MLLIVGGVLAALGIIALGISIHYSIQWSVCIEMAPIHCYLTPAAQLEQKMEELTNKRDRAHKLQIRFAYAGLFPLLIGAILFGLGLS